MGERGARSKSGYEAQIGALGKAVAEYERSLGSISAQELADQVRADRESAIVVRGKRSTGKAAKARRGKRA